MIEDRAFKDCETCLKRFEGIIADLQNQIKEQARIIQIQAGKIKELEERLNKDSHNSNKPPSTDDPYKKQTKSQRSKSGKKPGGQHGHPGTTLKKVANPDKKVRHTVIRCERCGENIENIKPGKIETRQVFDIPPVKLEVTEHQAEEKKCPNCGTKNKAKFPEDVVNTTQYGKNVKTFSVWLKNCGFVSYERIAEFLNEALGLKLSQATLQSFDIETAEELIPYEDILKKKLLQEPVLHADESGMRIEGKLNWFHSLGSERYTYYFPHEKRGGEAMKAMGILPEYGGVLIHDGWKSYWEFLCRHGLCNAHHRRELVWAYEEFHQDWAWDFYGLLLRIKNSKADHFPLKPKEIRDYSTKYDRILACGFSKNPLQKKTIVKRGKPKRGKILSLLDRLRDHKEAVLMFMMEKDVPFDNNLAERDIRMIRVQQKVSGTFRSHAGARAFCRIRSFISSTRKQGYKAFQAILDTLNGRCLIYMGE